MENSRHFIRKKTQDNMITERFDVIKNHMLGDYNDDGEYVIAPQIVKELLAMEKVKRTAFGNSIFCIGSLLGYGEIVFELYFDNATKNGKSAVAVLYVLEEVDKINGYLTNTIKTQVEEFAEDVDNFIEVTYKHFNIVESDDDDDEVLEQKNLLSADIDSSYILAKKQYSLNLEKLLDDKYLDAYGKYFTYRLASLTKLENAFSIAVLNSFNSQYAKIENVFLKEKNYKMLNELLDKSLEEISGTKEEYVGQEQQFRDATADALAAFADSTSKLNEKFENKALSMLEKEDRTKIETMQNKDPEKQENKQKYTQNIEQILNDVKSNSNLNKAKEETSPKISGTENTATQKENKNEQKSTNKFEGSSIQHYLQDKGIGIQKTSIKENVSTNENNEKSSYYDNFINSRNGPGVEKTTEQSVNSKESSEIQQEQKAPERRAFSSSLMDRINRRQEALDSISNQRKINSDLIEKNNARKLKEIQEEIDDEMDM